MPVCTKYVHFGFGESWYMQLPLWFMSCKKNILCILPSLPSCKKGGFIALKRNKHYILYMGTNFPEIWGPLQNSRHCNADMKPLPY